METRAGETVSVSKTADPVLELSLSPGEYRYRLVLYNALRKPEAALPWRGISVLRAELPAVATCEPKRWYIEDGAAALTLRGERLMPGASVVLFKAAPSDEPVAGIELGRDGTSSVNVRFPAEILAAGAYSLKVTNPGGLWIEVPDALVVRHKLGEPASLVPANGAVLGPAELRGTRAVGFSWEKVADAAEYVFTLYSAEEPERELRRELVRGTAFRLDDLTVLDRGEFRWSVEARGTDETGTALPTVGEAEARFRIDLPKMTAAQGAAAQDAGGEIFYGR